MWHFDALFSSNFFSLEPHVGDCGTFNEIRRPIYKNCALQLKKVQDNFYK